MTINAHVECDGAYAALFRKGAPDETISGNEVIFNMRALIADNEFQFSYSQIETTTCRRCHTSDTDTTVKMVLDKSDCSFINHVDIAIPNPDKIPLSSILKMVKLEYGGQRIDQFYVEDDLETQINTISALLGSPQRKVRHIDGVTFVPLPMAMLQDNNLMIMHGMVQYPAVYLVLTKDFEETNVQLYGKRFVVKSDKMNRVLNTPHNVIVTQCQYTGAEKMVHGVNIFKLNFVHPTSAIFFWGFDKTKVKNVKLTLDGSVFYNGSVQALEMFKASRGFDGDVKPVVIFFSEDKINVRGHKTVNFSRFNNPELIIETDDECESPVYIVAVNSQPLRYMNGMCGLAFSK